MRRDYKLIKREDIPFAENLVFWAPLTEGDLTDHISNITPITQGSATWDANKEMYLLDSTQNNRWKAALQYTKSGGFDINCTDGHTMCATMELVSSTWNYNAFFSCSSVYVRNNNWSSTKQCFAYVNEVVSGVTADGTEHLVCFTAKVGEWKFYVDGSLVSTGTGYTAAQQVNPPTQVDVCASNTNSNRIVEWVKDVRVYNRILTASEVAQL